MTRQHPGWCRTHPRESLSVPCVAEPRRWHRQMARQETTATSRSVNWPRTRQGYRGWRSNDPLGCRISRTLPRPHRGTCGTRAAWRTAPELRLRVLQLRLSAARTGAAACHEHALCDPPCRPCPAPARHDILWTWSRPGLGACCPDLPRASPSGNGSSLCRARERSRPRCPHPPNDGIPADSAMDEFESEVLES